MTVIDCPDCDGQGEAWDKDYCITCLGFGEIMEMTEEDDKVIMQEYRRKQEEEKLK